MSKTLRTLIIEDSDDDMMLLVRALRKGGYEPVFECVDTADAMADALSREKWDVVISDYVLPNFSGTEALGLVSKAGIDVPFIIVSGKIGEETAVETMKAGAHDYVMKDNLVRLVPALERELREAEVRRERRRAEEELRKYYAELEKRVEERTKELSAANDSLQLEIVERRQAERALRESEVKYSALVEQSRDGILVIQDETVRFANQGLADIYGVAMAELVGVSLPALFPQVRRGEIIELYNRLMLGERVSGIKETQGLCKDGIKDIEISMGVLQFSGRPAVMATVRNITERKQLEMERLTSSKLQSIGVLAGGIAHDFNNILTAILGNITLAKIYARPGDKVFQKLTEVERASLQAKDLTQQLFTFSRGGARLKKVTAIDKLIKDVASFAVRGAKTRCTYSIPEDLWPAEVDEGQIGQVIQNLILKSDQAMPQGGIIKVKAENVTVGLESTMPPGPGNYVKISIEDQGIGIPEEHLTKIFDPYFTTKQKGSGLGLATSYSVIKGHNGYINVESGVGVGTKVYVYLPASLEAVVPKKEPESHPEHIPPGKGRILIMDDEDMVRSVAKEMLAHLGYQVDCAGDGAEAIELFKVSKEEGRPIDAVIMDLTVPGGMGGKEGIRGLLRLDPKVKAIVSSGYSDDPIMSDFRRYGFSGVISKPYRIEDLAAILRNVIMPQDEESA